MLRKLSVLDKTLKGIRGVRLDYRKDFPCTRSQNQIFWRIILSLDNFCKNKNLKIKHILNHII